MRLILLFTTVITFSIPALAQNQDPILTLPDGQVIVSLSATERREVEQDLLVATLSYTVTNRDNRIVQNEINKAMKQALDLAKKEKEVKVQTGTYHIYETTEPRTQEKKWRGSQTLTMKSKEPDAVLKLAQAMQEMGLNMNGLSYTLSPETAVAAQDSLMADALTQLQERADRAAKALGKSSAELREVSTNGGGIPHHRVNHHGMERVMMSKSADMAPPVAAAGESTITMSVSARAILKP